MSSLIWAGYPSQDGGPALLDIILGTMSDYVGLLFLSSPNAGPTPRPNKSLVAYQRLHNITAQRERTLEFDLTLGSLARSVEEGRLTIFPRDYKIALDESESIFFGFSLWGNPMVVDTLPVPAAEYNFTVPVHIEPPSTEAHS